MYSIVEIEGKGKGMVATRNIQKGECIITEAPIIVYREQRTEDLAKFVRKLKKSEQDLFYSLHRQQTPNICTEADIAQTNSLPCGRDAPMRGIFPTISRINHSCVHNANHSWNSVTKKEIVIANEDIPEGTEVLICYASRDIPVEHRRAGLSFGFGFLCNCVWCTTSDPERDSALMRIRQCEDLILEAASSNPRQSIVYVNEALRLWRKYRKMSTEAQFCYDGYQICAMYGDYENAQKWADLLFDADLDGIHGEKHFLYKKYKKNPKSHARAGCAGIKRKLLPPDNFFEV